MAVSSWLLHDTASKRFPIYTRSNAAEVMGAPVSPLGWTYVWHGAFGPGTIEGYVDLGGFETEEFSGPEDAYGVFGGYFYLNLSPMLIQMERLADGGAAQMAAMFDKGPGMPTHVSEPWHSHPTARARLAETFRIFLAGEVFDDLPLLHQAALDLRAGRPDLASATPADLVARMRTITPLIRRAGRVHVKIGQAGMVALNHLQQMLDGIGRASDMTQLCTGIGQVESADIACQLWTISRVVRNSPLGTDDPAFGALFDRFIYDHGARASNEWDLIYDTFEIAPKLAMVLVNSMARQDESADPIAALEKNSLARRAILASIEAQFADQPEQLAAVSEAVQAVATWFTARERSKNMCVRLVHEARMCCATLQAAALASGAIAEPKHFYMLHNSELEAFIEDSTGFATLLADRYATYLAVADLEPPFFIDGACPPISEWPKRVAKVSQRSKRGDRLSGLACSPGVATGRARVILDPSDPSALEPGEILVTTNTNPSWTPLFLVAGAVITEHGLFNSHASIVSRELGIPCIASVEGVIDRIPDGAIVKVDGGTGQIEIMADAA